MGSRARKNSGFSAKFGPHDKPAGKEDRGTGWMNSQDKWYRGLNLQVAPDGGVAFAASNSYQVERDARLCIEASSGCPSSVALATPSPKPRTVIDSVDPR